MTADEIRDSKRWWGIGDNNKQVLIEIAAQLAELNQTLRVVVDTEIKAVRTERIVFGNAPNY